MGYGIEMNIPRADTKKVHVLHLGNRRRRRRRRRRKKKKKKKKKKKLFG